MLYTVGFRSYSVQRSEFCSIGSVKSNIGHCESAAGIAGLTKVLLQLKYGQLLPSIHSEKLNPHIDFTNSPFIVQQKLAEWKRPVINGVEEPRLAGISSFGAGGSNAHIILEEYRKTPKIQLSSKNEKLYIVVLSAKNEKRLKVYAKNMAEFFKKDESTERVNNNQNDVLQCLIKELTNVISGIIDISEDELNVESNIHGYGLDMYTIAEFCSQLGDIYGIEINSTILYKYHSIETVAKYLFYEYQEVINNHYAEGSTDDLASENTVNEICIDDIAYTLQVGRYAMQARLAVLVTGLDDLIYKLTEYVNNKKHYDRKIQLDLFYALSLLT